MKCQICDIGYPCTMWRVEEIDLNGDLCEKHTRLALSQMCDIVVEQQTEIKGLQAELAECDSALSDESNIVQAQRTMLDGQQVEIDRLETVIKIILEWFMDGRQHGIVRGWNDSLKIWVLSAWYMGGRKYKRRA